MPHLFQFQSSPFAGPDTTEANVFVHGYSAGHSDEDKRFLLGKIPDLIKHYTNIFAFWPSNHLLRLDKSSIMKLGAAGLNEYSHENRQAFASAAAIQPHAKPTGFRIVRH